jgi:putative ABC transport system permease protein
MSAWRAFTHGIRAVVRGRNADRDVDEELQHFVDESAREFEASGMAPGDAVREARRRLGNTLPMREQVRASGWEHAFEVFGADLRLAMRRLVRNPTFAAVTITTLAIGIGAATAILSVAAPVLVRTLPFPGADRLYAVWDRAQDGRAEVTFGSFLEVEQRSRTLESTAAWRTWQPALSGFDVPERLEGQSVSASYFQVFGVLPRLGRAFTDDDDRPSARAVVVISDRLWRRRFGADPGITGRPIVLDGSAHEVVGVMPAAFEHRLMPQVDVWRPLQYDRTLPALQGREWGHHLRMIARAREGVSRDAAAAELAQIGRDPIAAFTRPPWAGMAEGLTLEPLHADLTRQVLPAMTAVTAAAALLLLIACVNVTNLLLGRDASRRAEFAMRTALGAARSRLVRQLLTETLVLAALGGAAGMLLANLCVRMLVWLGPSGVPHTALITPEVPVLVLAAAITALVGLAVGLTPALANGDLRARIPQGSWQASSGHRSIRRGLVVAQVAFALVLLVGAGLLFQSLQRLFAISPGFDAHDVLSMRVQVAGRRYRDDAAVQRFFDEALAAVQRVPGVAAAALTTQLPLSGDADIYGLRFESSAADAVADSGGAFRYAVSPGYFDAMRIPLRRGRLLSEQDQAGPPAVLVSESLARRRFPNGDAIGQRLHIGPTDRPWFTIVGVVGDVTQLSLETDWFDAVYHPPPQWHFVDRAFSLVVRTHGETEAAAPAVMAAVWSVDKDQPIVRVATLESVVAATASERRFALLLFEAFGIAALLLTAVGIYGVVAGGVTDRTREIGIRTALGASRGSILGAVLAEGARMAGLGIAIGVLGALAFTRWLTALLFGVSPVDPFSYVAVVALLMGVTLGACWIPARRAAGVDPALTLRSE